MTDHTVITSGDGPVVLESDVPLSSSVIWGLQRDFYVQRGLKAWTEDQVPSYITNNPFIAEIYARIVFGFLRDCMRRTRAGAQPLSSQNPLRILELGAGSGKFSYLFMRKMADLMHAANIAVNTVRYCMTDCSENLLQSWRLNTYLSGFVKQGMLVFEQLQAGDEVNSSFVNSNSPGSTQPGGPLVLIANYVFDSLPQDAFVIKNGQILEALVTTTRNPNHNPNSEGELKDLQLSYKNVEVSPNRYPEESWTLILEQYRTGVPSGTVLFPCAALKALKKLGQCTDGRMLLLAADKAIAHEEDLQLYQGPPAIEFHGPGCFSQMVNFDAIGKYFVGLGGKALKPDKHSAGLAIGAFLQLRPGDEFPGTASAYRDAMAAFGPDDLFALLAWLHPHMEQMSIPQTLALLRLTRWDTTAFLRLFPVIARQLRSVGAERTDLRNAVLSTWANHYPVSAAENVLAFNCGVILLELRFFAEALPMFKASEQVLGRSAATSYNLGLCAQGLGKPAETLAFMTEACNLDPSFEPARSARAKLESQLKQS
jgi:Putative S-adenosyl-L-methionine-dependent methyltransferase